MDFILNKGLELFKARWRMLLFTGIGAIILGSLAIAASFITTMATVFVIGCLVLAGGIVHLIDSFHTRGWAGVFGHVLAAILYVVAGCYMIMHPAASAASLTLLIGMLLAAGGIYQIVASLAMQYWGWGWALLHGIVSLLLGVLIFAQWPASGLWLIGTFVGIDLIFRGWATLMLALAARAALSFVEKTVSPLLEQA